MADAAPQNTFRGLPLTPEQDAEVRHYLKKKKAAWKAVGHAGVDGDA
jgi:hypothetical protein